MREVLRILRLFAKNLALTGLCLILWLPIGYGAGTVIANIRYPSAAGFLAGRNVSVSFEELNRYRAFRDSIVMFSAWCGLVTAQSVFIVHCFGVDRRENAHPPGGFPVVKEAQQ
ncbi:MAG: hypothetical protein QOF78_2324 [Phycisphaerales bacterium]|jgi:hypothetical protein|nr:hypothetical protein [Phycisphaerales bacterium]